VQLDREDQTATKTAGSFDSFPTVSSRNERRKTNQERKHGEVKNATAISVALRSSRDAVGICSHDDLHGHHATVKVS
jgi:hypothetical protein